MAYNREEIYKQAIDVIEKNNLFFISDIIAFVPCSTSTFYEMFPDKSEESEAFKEKLNKNRVKTKSGIRAKLYKSQKAGELLALYRLICDSEERRNLNQSYIDHSTNGDKINNVVFTIRKDCKQDFASDERDVED